MFSTHIRAFPRAPHTGTSPLALFLAAATVVASTPGAVVGQRIAIDAVATGGRSISGAYVLRDVVGQSVGGQSSGTMYRVGSGFRYAAGASGGSIVTAVSFSGIDARVVNTAVVVRWTAVVTDPVAVFTLYRAHEGELSWVRVGETRLPGKMEIRDDAALPGTSYRYRVGARDADGEFVSREVFVRTPQWGTSLDPNVPNPFNPRTRIGFYLADPGPVSLAIYDARGARVRTLVDGVLTTGRHEVEWDGSAEGGSRAGSGVYFYRLRTGRSQLTRKMILLK